MRNLGKGVRIPAGTLERYNIGDSVILEEHVEGILLPPHGPPIHRLSFQETARQIAVDQIRTTTKSRIGKKLGALTQIEAATLRRIITEMYGE